MKEITFSWVLPIKNEAESLPQLFNEIHEVMGRQNFEIIAVNDASTDQTYAVLKKVKQNIPQLKIVHFDSHQGKWAALTAGIKRAKGEIIITLDSDLQDNPKQVRRLLQKLNEGFDIVSSWRKKRCDPYYKVIISQLGNRILSMLSKKQFKDVNSPFKVYRKNVLSNVPREGTLLRFAILFAHKAGYRVIEVPVIHRPRIYGKSKFGVIKYLRILYDLCLVLLLFSGSGRIRKTK